jgi:hypothetical protein
MVRGYDPVLSDPAAIFLDRITSLFTSAHKLTLTQAHAQVQVWLQKASYTSTLYKKLA